MNILPRLLFMFQSLPLIIPKSSFIALDKMILNFVWQNKRARVSYKRLQSPKKDGGLNLPDLQKYYGAAQLKTIMSWITEDTDTLWVEMEQNSCPVPLGYLPFMSSKEWKKLKLTNEWAEKTWKIWSKIRNKLGVSNSVSRVTKIAVNPDFHPSKTDNGFKKWMNKGLVYIDQLFDGQVLKSFQQLIQEFNLQVQDHYRFLQIRHYLQKNKNWESILKEPSKTEQFLIKCEGEKMKKGIISRFYRALQQDLKNKDLENKTKWEIELNILINENEWDETCLSGHKLTNSPNWREFDWKIKNRYFGTPIITAKYGVSSALCWRGCGHQGDLSHIMWACPKLQEYWDGVKRIIEQILDIKIKLDPKLFILGIPSGLQMGKKKTYLLRTLLLIAKKTITVLWLQPQPPNIKQWQQKVNEVYIMEKITAKIQLKTDFFNGNMVTLDVNAELKIFINLMAFATKTLFTANNRNEKKEKDGREKRKKKYMWC